MGTPLKIAVTCRLYGPGIPSRMIPRSKPLQSRSRGKSHADRTTGEVGTPGAEREWIVAEAELAIKHLIKTCGPPPPEMELEIQWQEHDLGSYPTIVLTWEDAMRGTPWNYISRCEVALTAYENGGELPSGWTMPPVRSEDDDPNEPFDPDEPPPEPPETLNVLEHQRPISANGFTGASKPQSASEVGRIWSSAMTTEDGTS